MFQSTQFCWLRCLNIFQLCLVSGIAFSALVLLFTSYSFFVKAHLLLDVLRLAHNVCVSAVVPFRSRVLSQETKRGTKIKLQTNSSRHHFRNMLLAVVFLYPSCASSFLSRVWIHFDESLFLHSIENTLHIVGCLYPC